MGEAAKTALPEAALPIICHLGAMTVQTNSTPPSVLWTKATLSILALALCDGPDSCSLLLSPLAPWLFSEPEVSRRQMLSPGVCALCGAFWTFSRNEEHCIVVEGVPFHYPASLRYMRHGQKLSASLWAMGITVKAKFTLMVSTLKHSH